MPERGKIEVVQQRLTIVERNLTDLEQLRKQLSAGTPTGRHRAPIDVKLLVQDLLKRSDRIRKTPGTMGTVRRADRMLAAQLYQRGVSVTVVENALVLAATRRLIRPTGAPPLGAIRSLAYFLPVIEEMRELGVEYLKLHVKGFMYSGGDLLRLC